MEQLKVFEHFADEEFAYTSQNPFECRNGKIHDPKTNLAFKINGIRYNERHYTVKQAWTITKGAVESFWYRKYHKITTEPPIEHKEETQYIQCDVLLSGPEPFHLLPNNDFFFCSRERKKDTEG